MGNYYVRDFEANTIWPEFVFTNATAPAVVTDGPGLVTEQVAGSTASAPATSDKSLGFSLYTKFHGNSDYSYVDLTLTLENAGTISYRRRVQSESCCDFFRFRIDGVVQESVASNDSGWAKSTFAVGAGSHTFRWEFTTDGSVLIGFSGYHLTDIEVSEVLASGNPSYTQSSGGGALGGGGGGGGVGNMLGAVLLGETLLGADPGPGTGGGNGYGNTSNMLGAFMLGEPMLGADPSNGSGTGEAVVGPVGNVYQLTSGTIQGRTAVTAAAREALLLKTNTLNTRTTVTASLTQSSLRAGYVVAGTTVTGRLSTSSTISATPINGRTSVSANLSKVIPPLSATPITGRTTVTGQTTRSILRGTNIYSAMYVAAYLNLNEQIRVEGIRGSTSVTASSIGLARPFSLGQQVTGRTSLTADLTYSTRLSGGQVVDYTTVSGSLTRSYLRGAISDSTLVTITSPTVRSAYSATIRTTTIVRVTEGGLRRTLRSLLSTDVQTIMAGTRVRGYTYVTPQDFVPIYLNTSTRVRGAAALQLRFGSANLSNQIHGSTSISGSIIGLQTLVGFIRGKTTVRGKARAGFGNELHGFAFVSGSLGVNYRVQSTSRIFGRTTVRADAPQNGTSGRAWGGTRFALTYGLGDALIPYGTKNGMQTYGHYIGSDPAYDFVSYYSQNQGYYQPNFPTLGIILALKVETSKGSTRFSTLVIPSRAWAHNRKGNPPFYGPYGSVSLYVSPKGDVGNGDFIDCQTLVGANMLALRHRLITLLSAAGLEFPGQITFMGDAVRGPGTKLVTGGTAATKVLAERAPQKQSAYYV